MNKIIYLDATASYQKSDYVIDAQVDFLRNHYANSGRGICANAMWTDDMIANVRRRVAVFMNADAENIVFTHGTTDAMNQIVRMLKLNSESVVAVSDLDHHSARLPFVMSVVGVVLCPLMDDLNIDKTKIPYADVLVLTAMSNIIGVAQDVAGIILAARKQNPDVIVVVDCAQFVVHNKIDVREWGADFVCCISSYNEYRKQPTADRTRHQV